MTNPHDPHAPAEALRLAAFIGEWRVEGTFTAGADARAIVGEWRYGAANDGWGVRGVLATEIEGMGAFEESELIGFDPIAGKVHLFSANRYAIRDHIGVWSGERTLLVRYVGVEDGKAVTEEFTIEFVAPDSIMAHVVEQVDGVVVATTDLTLAKQSSSHQALGEGK